MPQETIIAMGLFAVFAVYVLYQYVRWQMRTFNTYQYLLQLHAADTIYNTESCPICLHEFKAPARVSCGHAFCMRCLLNCFRHNSYLWKCICPLCRTWIRDFDCLYKFDFNREEKAEIESLEKQLRKLITHQNREITFVERFMWIRGNKWKIAASTTVIFTTFIGAFIYQTF